MARWQPAPPANDTDWLAKKDLVVSTLGLIRATRSRRSGPRSIDRTAASRSCGRSSTTWCGCVTRRSHDVSALRRADAGRALGAPRGRLGLRRAAVAMLTGKTYAELKAYVEPAITKREGLSCTTWEQCLAELGYALAKLYRVLQYP